MKLNLFIHVRARYGAEGIREPNEKIPEAKLFEPQRFSNRDLLKSLKMRALNAYSEEGKCLRLFSGTNSLRGLLPCVRRRTIGDQEYPGTVVRNSVQLIGLFPLFQQRKCLLDRGSHRCVTGCLQPRRLKLICGLKIAMHLDRTKGDQRNFDSFLRQRISRKLILECDKSIIKLGDWLASHRSGCVKEQDAWAARLGIFGKFGAAERNLIKSGTHLTLLAI